MPPELMVPLTGRSLRIEASQDLLEKSGPQRLPESTLKRWRSLLPPWIRAVSIALLGALFALFLYPRFVPTPKSLSPRQVRQIIETHLKERPLDPTLANRAFNSIYRSLVLIRTQKADQLPLPAVPSQSSPPDKPKQKDDAELGTGFVVNKMGTILTCFPSPFLMG